MGSAGLAQRHQQAEEQADEDKRELAADLASERANCSKSDTQNPDVIAACAHYAADKEIAANRPDPDLGDDAYSAYRDRLQDQALVEALSPCLLEKQRAKQRLVHCLSAIKAHRRAVPRSEPGLHGP